MEFVPLGVKHLRHIPGEGLKLPIEVQDGKLHCLARWVETYGKLGVPLCVGDPYKMPRIGPRTPVPERRHKAELLWQALIEDTKGVHPQVGCRIYPVRSLHLVRATHPRNQLSSFRGSDHLHLATPGYPSRFTSNSNFRMKSKD